MSNPFSKGGNPAQGSGSSGLVNPTQPVSIPYFTSQGGVTPEQQSYIDYTTNQDRLGEASMYGGEGLGASTMATQGAEGAATTGAELAGKTSDINTSADYGVYQNDVQNFISGLTNQTSLDQIAQQATDLNAQQQQAQDQQTAAALGKAIGSGVFGNQQQPASTG